MPYTSRPARNSFFALQHEFFALQHVHRCLGASLWPPRPPVSCPCTAGLLCWLPRLLLLTNLFELRSTLLKSRIFCGDCNMLNLQAARRPHTAHARKFLDRVGFELRCYEHAIGSKRGQVQKHTRVFLSKIQETFAPQSQPRV